jgi:2-methylcitrate dehydratase PrpD
VNESRELAAFCAGLRFEHLPERVVQRLLELTLDWTGSCLAGSVSRQAGVFQEFARDMGPDDGPSRIFGVDKGSSPLFAALCNAAASHVVEQDDLHNSSVFHPATVVFPPLLAVAQSLPVCSGREFLAAAAAGYESGIRVGEFLGRSHYRVFHTTGTAGTIAAAMAVARLLGLDSTQTLHALGSAGSQAAGLWEFLGDAADSKQLHTAKAAADGLLSAWTARQGLTGAGSVLEGEQGMGAGMLGEGDPMLLTAGLGSRWALAETSFKYHASCRHTHPAADAMLAIRDREGLNPADVEQVTVYVYRAAREVLGAVTLPETIHQSKFSMGFVLALILYRGHAGVADFSDESLADPGLRDFTARVRMVEDAEIEAMYPKTWCARVEVKTRSGTLLSSTVDAPRGDPENPLSPEEIAEKVRMLAQHFSACDGTSAERIIANAWRLPGMPDMRDALNP